MSVNNILLIVTILLVSGLAGYRTKRHLENKVEEERLRILEERIALKKYTAHLLNY